MRTNDTHHALIQTFICTDYAHRRLFERKMASIGVHRSQHRILMYLAEHRGEAISQKDIAARFDISPAAITVTLKKLEAGGYITRRTLKDDNRVNMVTATDKALAVVEKTKQFSDELEEVIFADFSDRELECFAASLEKMQKAMHEYEAKMSESAEPISAWKGDMNE